MHKDVLINLHSSEWRSSKTTMRKYYQLTLVIISVVSIVSLLIYRHEYNRLRYVLEVLNFFGSPGQSSSTNDCTSLNITHLNYDILGFREHLPSWQRISSSYSVYSAYWETNEGNSQVKAIGVGLLKGESSFKCHVWFEDESNPVPGKFNYTLLFSKESNHHNSKPSKPDGLSAHFLYCKPFAILENPIGVSFYIPSTHVPFKPFIPVQTMEDRTIVENSTLVCVAPSLTSGIRKSSVIEFFSYHQLIGINDFIVYDQTVPSQFPVVLQNHVVQERFNLRVLFLPWNFPYPMYDSTQIMRVAIEKDCVMRGMGKVRNIAVLSWNDYIVPKIAYHHSFSIMLDNLESNRRSIAQFNLSTIVFCTDLPDDPRSDISLPMAARKTKCLKGSALDKRFHVYRPLPIPGNRTGRTQIVPQSIVAVHQYVNCFKEMGAVPSEDKVVYEPTILKFVSEFKRSKLYRAGETNKLFQ